MNQALGRGLEVGGSAVVGAGTFVVAQAQDSGITHSQAGITAVITGIVALIVPRAFEEIKARRLRKEQVEEAGLVREVQSLRKENADLVCPAFQDSQLAEGSHHHPITHREGL